MVTVSCLIVVATLFSQATVSMPSTAETKAVDVFFCFYIARLFLGCAHHTIIYVRLCRGRQSSEPTGGKKEDRVEVHDDSKNGIDKRTGRRQRNKTVKDHSGVQSSIFLAVEKSGFNKNGLESHTSDQTKRGNLWTTDNSNLDTSKENRKTKTKPFYSDALYILASTLIDIILSMVYAFHITQTRREHLDKFANFN